MTNKDILRMALPQSTYDCNCRPEDFLSGENRNVLSKKNEKARNYLPLPFEFDLVTYGNGIVAQVSPRIQEIAQWYIGKYPAEHCFETPNAIALNGRLAPMGHKVCLMAEYFLPDMNALEEKNCGYTLQVLEPENSRHIMKTDGQMSLPQPRASGQVGCGRF